MAITSSIYIPKPSRNAWALNVMAYRLCARPFLSTDDVSLQKWREEAVWLRETIANLVYSGGENS